MISPGSSSNIYRVADTRSRTAPYAPFATGSCRAGLTPLRTAERPVQHYGHRARNPADSLAYASYGAQGCPHFLNPHEAVRELELHAKLQGEGKPRPPALRGVKSPARLTTTSGGSRSLKFALRANPPDLLVRPKGSPHRNLTPLRFRRESPVMRTTQWVVRKERGQEHKEQNYEPGSHISTNGAPGVAPRRGASSTSRPSEQATRSRPPLGGSTAPPAARRPPRPGALRTTTKRVRPPAIRPPSDRCADSRM